jgi:hypothetical protein
MAAIEALQSEKVVGGRSDVGIQYDCGNVFFVLFGLGAGCRAVVIVGTGDE